MPTKPYEQLAPQTQQTIDAAIYITEADRIMNRTHYDDERDVFANHPALLVNYLRGLYALDSQTRPPRYFDWAGDSAAIVRRAISTQQNIIAASDLVDHLTNMPYPQQPAAPKRDGRS